MDYELAIKEIGKDRYNSVDLGEERPAMVYQMNDLAELKDRRTAFSHTIKLPKTRKNSRIFGYIEYNDVRSDIPYLKHKCELFAGGVRVSPIGAVLIIDRVDFSRTGFIHCQIISGFKDLFETLKGLSGENIGGKNWEAEWSREMVISDNRSADRSIKWLRTECETDSMLHNPTIGVGNTEVREMNTLTPSLHLFDTVKKIFRIQGYDIETNLGIPTGDFYDIVKYGYITCSAMKTYAEFEDTAIGKWDHPKYLLPPNLPFEEHPHIAASSCTSITSEVTIKGGEMQLYAASNGRYRIDLSVSSPSIHGTVNLIGLGIQIVITVNGLQVYKKFADGETRWTDSVEIELKTGDIAGIVITERSNASELKEPQGWVTIGLTASRVGSIHPFVGGKIDLLQCTSFESQYDIVKAFLQLTGSVISVKKQKSDYENGVVEIYTYREFADRINEGKYLNWSDKLFVDSTVTRFEVDGYAQKNIIRLEDNEEGFVHPDEAVFTVSDQKLDSKKELFTIKIATSRCVSDADNDQVKIPVVPTHSDGELTETGTQLLICPYDNGWLSSYSWIQQGSSKVKVPLWHAYIPSLQKDAIGVYYKELTQLIGVRAQVLDVELNLSIIDMGKLDLFTPIYLSQFGAYYYINKINNYVMGKLTQVQLIKYI